MKKYVLLFLITLTAILLYGCKNTNKTNSSKQIITTGNLTTNKSSSIITASTTTKRPDSQNTNPVTMPVAKGCATVEGHDGWVPVWCDEFDVDGAINSANWKHETGAGGWGNNEVQSYTNRLDNSKVEDGKLIITAKKETYNGGTYTSARLVTAGKYSFKYGRVDVKAKLPSAGGSWPAIWMMPQGGVYGSWPNSGEVDIMEHIGNKLNWIMASIHTGKYYWKNNNQISSGYVKKFDNASTEFHEYSIIWDEEGITWLVDNKEYFTTVGNQKLKPESNLDVDPSMAWPFDQEFFIILNVAVGGNMGGAVSSSFIQDTMEVDYVRVSKKDYVTNDQENPSPVSNLRILKPYQNSIYLAWDRAIDDEHIKGYNIYLNGKYKTFTSRDYIRLTGLYLDTYVIDVEAVDYSGKVSDLSTVVHTWALNADSGIEAENYLSEKGTQIANCTDILGGKYLIIEKDDYVQYLLQVDSNEYIIHFRIASETGGSFDIVVDGVVIDTIEFDSTGGAQKWKSIETSKYTFDKDKFAFKIVVKEGQLGLNNFTFLKP